MAITTLPRTGLEQFQGLLGQARGLLGDKIAMIPGLGAADALNRIQQGVRSGDYKSAVSAASDVIPVGRVATGLIGAATKGKASGLLGDVMNVARPKTDEATGLPLNPDGTVTVYHHTTAANAAKIAKDKLLRSAGEPDVYFTSRKETDTGYGDTAVPIKINPSKLQVDDEFPDGRIDFRVNVGSKRQLPITLGIQGGTANATDTTALNRYETEFDRKMALAQQRAALPVEQGGLGLAPDNTPMQRAQALGNVVPMYHGTGQDIMEFDPNAGQGARSGTGTNLTNEQGIANTYAGRNGGNVMPLLVNPKGFAEVDFEGANWNRAPEDGVIRGARYDEALSDYSGGDYLSTNDIGRIVRDMGERGVIFNNIQDRGGYVNGARDVPQTADNMMVFDPSRIRSRFAAFDPFRRKEADLLAFNGTIGSSGLLNINPLLGLLGNQE